MASLNTISQKPPVLTREGGHAYPHASAEQLLRRSVLSCLLWEDSFYESGISIADRIETLAKLVRPEYLAALAVEAREEMNLRHVPLLLAEILSKLAPELTAATVARVVKRADEPAELLAILWRNGRKMIPHQMQKGLRQAYQKFDEYQFDKYEKRGPGTIKNRDVIRLVRPKPKTDAQAALWGKVRRKQVAAADTWSSELTAGKDGKETFERLMHEGNLGYFALLRNLRNMDKFGVDADMINAAIIARQNGARKVLPFRYVAAARAMPKFEKAIDQALLASLKEVEQFDGETIILVDVSGSMNAKLSAKSDLSRQDAAGALAALFPGNARIFSFSNYIVEVPNRRGMAGIDAIRHSQASQGTYLGAALRKVMNIPHDRLIVITDEQSADDVPAPRKGRGYMINVAAEENGVGYGDWMHIDGFSENVFRFMAEIERGL